MSKVFNKTYACIVIKKNLGCTITDIRYHTPLIYKNGGTLSSHGFSEYENYIISTWFGNRFNMSYPKLVCDKRCNKFYVQFNTDMSKAINDEIREFVIKIPGMEYKIWSK
jgi:hypothetical protein